MIILNLNLNMLLMVMQIISILDNIMIGEESDLMMSKYIDFKSFNLS